MKLHLRLADPTDPSDASAIVRLSNALASEEGDHRGLFTRAALRRCVSAPQPLLRFALAECDGAPVGHAAWFDGFDTGESYRIAFVMDLYVEPAWRRQGIGRRLLRFVARQARLRARDRLCWGVLPRRRSARRFYAALGAESDYYLPLSIAAGALSRRSVDA